jgi:hypothetical protein
MLTLACAAITSSAGAATVAHWRFENAVDEASGDVVPGATGLTPDAATVGDFPAGPFSPNPAVDYIPDVSGNNNRLYAFNAGTSGSFSSSVAHNPVPQTGATNNFSWDISAPTANGAPRDLYEIGTGNIRSAMSNSPQFTVEASFRQTSDVGFQAIVGRDRAAGDTGGPPLAAFWFGVCAGDGAPGSPTADPRLHFYTWNPTNGIDITDMGQTGLSYFGVGPVIEQNVWYDTAVVGDGTLYKLYLKKATDPTYTLIWANVQAGLGQMNGGWTVGRGQFDLNPADGFKGLIDEVRISNSALSPAQFLGSVPEPSTGLMLALAVALAAGRRGRRCKTEAGV